VTLLVIGEPRSGKTGWCRDYVDRRRKCGPSVGGILSPAVEKQGQRVGSGAIDLLTGQQVPFARLSRCRPLKKGEVAGDYTISRDGISFACGAIKQAIESRCDPVVIDEVGPPELRGRGLMAAAELALASAVNVRVVVRSSLKEALQRRFAGYEFTVIADLTESPSDVSELPDCESHEPAAHESPTERRQAQKEK
jgi:nucleoside-triphosphatase THEP1